MEFDPNNLIIILCMRGMALAEKGNSTEATKLFLQAWNEAANDFEKLLAAHFIARQQKDVRDKLKWSETALHHALLVNNPGVSGALPSLYSNLAKCYEDLGDPENAKKNQQLAGLFIGSPADNGPFYHGTRADLKIGDLLTAGSISNYNATITMNHIYFTALVNGAGLAAALAKGNGHERVYIIEPTGNFENDPNVTDKKFPGNLTRSYRSESPLKIIGEVTDWVKQTTEQIRQWRKKLDSNKGEIIN